MTGEQSQRTDPADGDPVLSVIVPVYNEEKALPETRRILTEVLDGLGREYEVLVVDNCSQDRTEAIAQEIMAAHPRWRYARLSRNFGYQNSITAGMAMARGQAIVVIDCDLQDPPEMIGEFLKKWDEGYEVVYGVRIRRTEEPPWRIWLTMHAMRLISWCSDYPIPEHGADFRLISHRVRDAFVAMEESNRYVRGMIHWLGFKQIGIPYTRRGRQFGGDGRRLGGTGFSSLVKTLVDAIFGFSLKPLRLFTLLGAAVLVFTALLVPVQIVLLTLGRVPPPGFTTLLFLLLSNLGVTALGTGILGEYLGRTYSEVKRRPLWIVDYTLNFSPGEQPALARPGPTPPQP